MHSRCASMFLPALVIVGVSTLLSACSGGPGDDDGGGNGFGDVLDLAPAEATYVDFRDRQAWADRLGIADDADVDAYVDALLGAEEVNGGATSMTPYVRQMAEGSAFDDRDVVWELSGRLDERSFTVLRIEDDVDLDELVDDLVDAGLTEDELRGRRHASGDPVTDTDAYNFIGGTTYPFPFIETTIDVDEHLVILGYGSDEVLATIDGDRDSLADAGTFDAVLDGADPDDAEVVSLFTDAVCAIPTDDDAISEQARVQRADLGRPLAMASTQTGEDELAVSARLAFEDEDAAERDLEARRTYLAEGISLTTGGALADDFTADLRREGSVVVVDIEGEEPRAALQVGDGALACGPQS